jgi:hypothetical protein
MLHALNFLSLKLYILPPRTAASICPPPSYDPDNMKLRLISLRLMETKGKNQKNTRLVAPCSRGNFSGKLIRRVDGRSGDTTCRAIRLIFRRSSKWRFFFSGSVSNSGLSSLFRPTVTYFPHQNIQDLIRHNDRRRGLPTPIRDAQTRFMWGNLQERTTY